MSRLSLFWRIQLCGWTGHFLYAYPLKWITLEDHSDTLIIALYRDGLGFVGTLLMREIYRRIYGRMPLFPAITLVAAGASLLGGAIIAALVLGFHQIFGFQRAEVFTPTVTFAIFYFQTGLLAGWSALYFGIKIAWDSARRDVLLAKTESGRQRAELQMLRSQMNPHFLFNALSSIRVSLLPAQTDLKRVVDALAAFLRYSLEHRTNDLVPMEKEFEAMVAYLAVEKARYRDEIEIETRIADEAKPVLVPGIVLQPLVENAIKYGRKTSPKPLQIRLTVEQAESSLRIEVANTGRWLPPDARDSVGGVGLSNLRQRLSILYPTNHELIVDEREGWVVVTLHLPLGNETGRSSRPHRR